MKFFAVLSLLALVSTAQASEKFGGVTFDASVPNDQIDILKKDLTYLYQNSNNVNDEDFLATTGLEAGTGDHLHNWIINRVRYIVGEEFTLEKQIKLRFNPFFRYPKTPLPDAFNSKKENGVQEEQPEKKVRTVMSNIGGAVYLIGKKSHLLLGLKLDEKTVTVKSPRTGLLQVGEGLFYEGFLINKDNVNAPANSVSRLGTLFHEARHSDGNGKSTGFLHNICPEGHPYAGYAACELSGNGSYTVGALAERHLLKNCHDCSTQEQATLTAVIADEFDRIFDVNKVRAKADLEAQIKALKEILETYRTLNFVNPALKGQIDEQIAQLESRIAELEKQLKEMSIKPDQRPASLDAKAEGKFKDFSVKASSKLMKSSLEN